MQLSKINYFCHITVGVSMAAHMQRNSTWAACDGGPVVLRPVMATP